MYFAKSLSVKPAKTFPPFPGNGFPPPFGDEEKVEGVKGMNLHECFEKKDEVKP